LKPASPFDVFYLTTKILTSDFSVWYSPGFNAPLFGLDRYVFTIHDLNHIDLSANSSLLKRLYYRFVLKSACRKAARVLTVSEFSRQRIIEWAGVEPYHVVNVGNGVSPEFTPDNKPYQPGFPYLLCIGNRKRHKNEHRVLQAFAEAGLAKNINLLYSGVPSASLLALAARLGVSDRVVFLGCINADMLPSIYRGAIALVFPSLYEGFGLPVIEAMACGTPVITSNSTALLEVAGNAAILVNPLDTKSIADAIMRIVGNESLRYELIAKGLKRSKTFTWDSVAEKVQSVLTEVADKTNKI
jgi:glycosyltransferase involved in cell wall biosynthesis